MHIDWTAVGYAVTAAAVSYKIAQSVPMSKGLDSIPMAPLVATGPLGFFLGHAADEMFELWESLEATYDAQLPEPLKHAGRCHIARMHSVIVGHPDDIDYIFVKNNDNFPKDTIYGQMFSRLLGRNSLFTIESSQAHAGVRKHLVPAFAPAALKHIANSVVPKHATALIEALAERARAGKPFVVAEDFSRTTLHTIAEAAFKTQSSAETKKIAELFKWLASDMWSMARVVPGMDPLMVRHNRKVAVAREFLEGQVRNIKENLLQTGEIPTDRTTTALIDYLVYSGAFSEEALVDQSITFMFAGQDTALLTLSWMAYLLAKHPQTQEKLHEELSATVGAEKVCEVDELKNCKFLVYCIKETLRLYPVGPGSIRRTTEDDVLPGTKTFIPKGTQIAVQFWVPQRHQSIWGPDAAEFRPERWADLAANGNPEFGVRAWFSFSRGARSCIGKDFAMNELMILGAAVYRNYKLTLVPGKEPRIICRPGMRPREPIYFNIACRDGNDDTSTAAA